jgi:hypothetical protein
MVPSASVLIDAMPMTMNGKVDRQVLPPPDGRRSDLEKMYIAPRMPLDKTASSSWEGIRS